MNLIGESIIAPVPPPLPPISKNDKSQSGAIRERKELSDEKDELDVALKRMVQSSDKPLRIFHTCETKLKSQIQIGPKCGLVALSIATSMDEVSPVKVDNLFEKALSLGYTKKGEIFSVEFLTDLAEKCCGFDAKIIKGGLNSHFGCIVRNLLSGNLLLVPYDSDRNHSPCCRKGYKSHWSVISGFVILSEVASDEENGGSVVSIKSSENFKLCDCENNDSATKSDENRLKFHATDGKIIASKENVKNDDLPEEGRIYLIGRQGKSSHLGLWPFDKMAESNGNLVFFSTERNAGEYVLPEGGPAEGLKSKAILLKVKKRK